MGLITPVLLLVLIGLAVWLVRREAAGVRRPRRRPPLVRAACGILGFGGVAAVALGTWLDARATYAPPSQGPGEVRLPTLPSPTGPPQSGRYLLHFVVARTTPLETRWVQVVGHEIRLPADAGTTIRPALSAPGYDIDFECAIQAVRADDNGRLKPFGRYELKIRRHLGSGMTSGTLHDIHVGFVSPTGRDKRWLSLSPGQPHQYSIFCLPTRAADDDPLRAAPAAELARLKEAELQAGMRMAREAAPGRAIEDGPPGLRFLAHLGSTSFVLIAAAVLLSQTASRKSLAFAGWLAAIVILAGAMDRAALGIHAGRLLDARATARERQLACLRMADTFFFRKTARREVEKVLQDPALREAARTALPILD